jgi:hypothetical protein
MGFVQFTTLGELEGKAPSQKSRLGATAAATSLEDAQLPFFIQWLSKDHPSSDGKSHAKIVKIEVAGDEKDIKEYCGCDMAHAVDDIEVVWVDPADNDGENGIIAVHLQTPNGVVRID